MVVLEDAVSPTDINFSCTVKVEEIESRKVKIIVPEELRLTERLLKFVNDSLRVQGFELAHMDITEAHKVDLKGLPNVVLNEGKGHE